MIGILYESDEWSSYALDENIRNRGVDTYLCDLEKEINEEKLFSCRLVVNRVFASSQFRGHQKSLAKMSEIISRLKEKAIPMINPYKAHDYEISKMLSTKTLEEQGIAVPKVFGTFDKGTAQGVKIAYPCIIKPNCGGRTSYTYILHHENEFRKAIGEIPDIEMIAQAYIEPVWGYVTRIEVIDRECKLILKRSVAANGLSAYHLGSTYERYDHCSEEIKETAIRAMAVLEIETGSMDLIENEHGFFIIDVNSVSNASEDNTKVFQFDLMLETAKYVVKKYKIL